MRVSLVLECVTRLSVRMTILKESRELEGFLKENGIDYKYSEMSKFAIFRAGKLP